MTKDFDTIADEQGWNDSTLVMILREYIDNQGDAAALADHARRIVDEENAEAVSVKPLDTLPPIL